MFFSTPSTDIERLEADVLNTVHNDKRLAWVSRWAQGNPICALCSAQLCFSILEEDMLGHT